MKFDQIKKIYFTLTEGKFTVSQEKQNKFFLKETKNNSSKQTIKIMSNHCLNQRVDKAMLEIDRKTDQKNHILHDK